MILSVENYLFNFKVQMEDKKEGMEDQIGHLHREDQISCNESSLDLNAASL